MSIGIYCSCSLGAIRFVNLFCCFMLRFTDSSIFLELKIIDSSILSGSYLVLRSTSKSSLMSLSSIVFFKDSAGFSFAGSVLGIY